MTANDIIARVCSTRGVTVMQVKGPARVASIARARHEIMWLLREATEMSLPEIGRAVGRKNHTTALAAIRKIQRLVDEDPIYGVTLHAMVRRSIDDQIQLLANDIDALNTEIEERRERLRQLTGLANPTVDRRAA